MNKSVRKIERLKNPQPKTSRQNETVQNQPEIEQSFAEENHHKPVLPGKPNALSPENLLNLQRTIGNRAVQRLLTSSKNTTVQRWPWSKTAVAAPVTLPPAHLTSIDGIVNSVSEEALKIIIYPYVRESATAYLTSHVKGSKKATITSKIGSLKTESGNQAATLASEGREKLLNKGRVSLKNDQGADLTGKDLTTARREQVRQNYQLKQLSNKKTEGKLAKNMQGVSVQQAASDAVKTEFADTKLLAHAGDVLNKIKPVVTNVATEKGAGFDQTKNIAEFEKHIKPDARQAAFTEATKYRKEVTGAALKTIQGKTNKAARDVLKVNAASKALEIAKVDLTDTAVAQELKDAKISVKEKATALTLEGEGGIHTKFAILGKFINKLIPKNGDKSSLEVTLKIPVDPHGTGAAFVGLKFAGDIARDGETEIEDGTTSLGASLAIVAGGQIPSGVASIMGELGGYIQAASKNGGVGVMDLLSYNLYRQFRESPLIPREMTNYMWGMGGASTDKPGAGDKDKAKYQEAEDWSRLVEADMGKEDFVETGVYAGVSGKVGYAGIAGAKAEASAGAKIKTGLRYSKDSIEKFRDKGHGQDQGAANTTGKLAGRGRQKGLGSSVMTIEFEAEGGAGIVGGEGSLSLTFVTSLSSAGRAAYGFSDRLLDLSIGLGGYVGLPGGTPGVASQIIGAAIPGVAGIFQSAKSTIGKAVTYFKERNAKAKKPGEMAEKLAKLSDDVDKAQNQAAKAQAQAELASTSKSEAKKAYGADSRSRASEVGGGVKSASVYKNVADYALKGVDTGRGIHSSVTDAETFDRAKEIGDMAEGTASLKDALGGTTIGGITKVRAGLNAGWTGESLMPSVSLTLDLDSSTDLEVPGYLEVSFGRTSRIAKLTLLPPGDFGKLDLGLRGQKERK